MYIEPTPDYMKYMPQRELSPQQLAHNLLYTGPARMAEKYGGLDNTLRINIAIAEDVFARGGKKALLDQYGSMTIIGEMKALKAALAQLAEEGPQALNLLHREALAAGPYALKSLMGYCISVAEANYPGITHGSYSKSRHVGHYLLEAQRMLVSICGAIGIEEYQQ